MTVTLSLQGAAAVQGRYVLAIPFRHAEFISASVQTCIVAKIWIVSENFFKPKFPTCIVSLSFLTFIFSFCVLQAKREGAEAGGLRAGGSRNAVYGDRVRQKENELIP